MCVKRAIPPEQKRQQLALLVTNPSSLIPESPLTPFSKTVCNLKGNFFRSMLCKSTQAVSSQK